MTDLATRCEQAEGPDRALDCLIHESLGHAVDHAYAEMHSAEETPFYTASLDAALTLVPEGLVFNMGNDAAMCWAYVWDDVPEYDGEPYEGRASTPALALCAAALRAHAKDQDDG